jgi:hypothetical protein
MIKDFKLRAPRDTSIRVLQARISNRLADSQTKAEVRDVGIQVIQVYQCHWSRSYSVAAAWSFRCLLSQD